MNRLSTVLILTAVSSLLTPVVVSATGVTPAGPAAQAQQAKAEAAAPAQARAETPACARRVKVVYAGYGEGRGAVCTVTAEIQR